MEQVIFIVWRESVEALLVVGILQAWLSANPEGAGGKRFLWGGVIAGLLLAALLAVGFFAASELFGSAQDYFQLGMVLVACGLIVQMVHWMRRHGRTLKKELHAGLSRNAETQNWWGVATLAALAVAREGSEAVIFLYGMLAGADQSTLWSMGGAGLIGLALAIATYGLLQWGRSALSWQLFFRLSEAMLLLLAAALLINGVDRLISMDLLPTLVDPLWDSSALLDDSTQLGGVVAALTGYRAQPALSSVLIYAGYWTAVLWLLRAPRSAKPAGVRA